MTLLHMVVIHFVHLRHDFQAPPAPVAQIFNLLYRRFSTCGHWKMPTGLGMGTVRRLQIGDTADCKSALLWLRLCRAGKYPG